MILIKRCENGTLLLETSHAPVYYINKVGDTIRLHIRWHGNKSRVFIAFYFLIVTLNTLDFL
jgi:hypothetical protein